MVKGNTHKKIKIEKVKSEEQTQIEKLLIIIGIILVFTLIVYVFTKVVVKKELNNSSNEVTAGIINYDKLIVGNMLNQNYEEYYVFVYNGKDNDAIYYGSIIDSYVAQKGAKKAYWIDLDNELNKKFISDNKEEINKKPKNLSDLKFGKYTLLKVKNQKIEKYIDNLDAAKKELFK